MRPTLPTMTLANSFARHPGGQDSGVNMHEPVGSPQIGQHVDEEHVFDFASDSGFDSGSLVGGETDSLASSILNHRIENGRQYHAYRDGSYCMLPAC